MDQQHYLWAWGIYLLAAAGFLLFLWRITRWRRPEWRAVPRVLVAALLLTPLQIEPGSVYRAPAFMVALMAAINEGSAAALPALQLIGTTALVALLLSLAYYSWLALRRRRAHHQDKPA